MSRSDLSNPEPEDRRAVGPLPSLSGALGATRDAIRKNALVLFAFFIPVAVVTVIMYLHKIHPFGEYSLVNEELFRTYLPLLTEFRRKLLSGDSLFYSWNIGYGVNFFSYIGMFLSGPLNLLVIFFPESAIPGLITFQVLLRVGLSGLGFAMLLREKDQLRNAFLPALSSAYALGGFMVAYAREGYIADAVVLLPFVLLGAWRVIRGRKPILFAVTLFLLMLSSSREALFIGLFLILMIPLMYMEAGGKRLEKPSKIPLGIRFVLYSLLAVAGAAVVLIPTWIAFRGDAGPFKFPDDLKMYFTFFDLGDRLLFRTVPEFARRMPNIYCGVAVLLLVPLYAFCDRIAFRERVFSLTLVGFLYVAMSGNIVDYALNGLQVTENYHFKQAFLLSFLLLYMASRALRYAETFSRKTIFLSVLGVFAFLILDDHSGELQRAWQAIYGTAVLVLVFAMCVRALSGVASWHRAARTVFLILMVAELSFSAIHATDEQVRSQGLANYALHSRYATLVREGIQAETDASRPLFRVSADEMFTDYDGAYAGVMVTDSPVMNEVNGMLLGIGGELRFVGKTALPDSGGPIGDIAEGEVAIPPLGVGSSPKLNDRIGTHPADSTATFEIVEFAINRHALPVAYRVDSGILQPFDAAFASPFDNTDTVVNLMGLEPLYADKAFTVEDERNLYPAEGNQFSFVSESGSAYMLVRPVDLSVGERLFLSIDTKLEARITVRTFKADGGGDSKTLTVRNGRIIDCGTMTDENTRIEVGIIFPVCDTEPFSLIVKSITEQAYDQAFRTLENQSLQVGRMDGSGIRGNIEVERDGVLFFSVPYEKGWSVRIDGRETGISKAAGEWLSVPITSGVHLVTARYTPPGFVIGLLTSIIAVAAFVLLNIWNPGRVMGFSRKKEPTDFRSDI